MQQLVILLLINCSSTCFGRLYAHPQEVRLRFHYITTVTTGQINICSENAVWPPDDGRIDARNTLRNNLLTIKSLIVASSWSHIYLLYDQLLHLFLSYWLNVMEHPIHKIWKLLHHLHHTIFW